MSYTKTQLATDVLMTMGVLDADGTPSASDLAYIGRIYDAKHGEWATRDLIYWPNTGDNTAEIPVAVYVPLRDLIINQTSNAYGKALRPVREIMETEEMLLKGLRRVVARSESGFPTRVDTY